MFYYSISYLKVIKLFRHISWSFACKNSSTMQVKQQSDNFVLVKRLLRIGGISLEEKEKKIFRIYSAFIFTFNIFPFLQFIGIPKYLQTERDVFEFVLFQFIALIIVAKAVVVLTNRLPMGVLLNKLQSGLLRTNTERGGIEENNLMNRCVEETNIQIVIYWFVVTGTTSFGLLASVYWRFKNSHLEWKYEFGPFTIFNASYSPNFEIAFLYQGITWVALGFMFVGSELLTVVVLAHITCQLKILQNSIRRMCFNSYKRMIKEENLDIIISDQTKVDISKIPWKYLQPVVGETVRYHLAIIDIAQQIENTFNILVLLILLSAIAIIGGFSYQIEFIHIAGISCQMSEISLICYWGNEVSLESQNVIQACYEVQFFGADLRFQKSLFLIMERSKRPITFTAGKFSPLTLVTFISIARAAYSFMLILRRVA